MNAIALTRLDAYNAAAEHNGIPDACVDAFGSERRGGSAGFAANFSSGMTGLHVPHLHAFASDSGVGAELDRPDNSKKAARAKKCLFSLSHSPTRLSSMR